MSSKSSISREYLVKAASLVRPAISNQSYIPALTHIKFADGWATTYNDVSAIAVKSPVEDLDLCIPGELLIKSLGSFGAAEVMVQENSKEGSVLITSGRSKLKLPTLPAKDFPFQWPEEGNSPSVVLTDSILKGIERCLISVGNDPTHPAQMGVTLESDGGTPVLFSTDNFTISRFAAKGKIKLPADSPVILPTFFCEQLISLSKVFSDAEITLHLLPGSILATFDAQAQLFTKMVTELEPVDFTRMVNRYFKIGDVKANQAPLPEGFEAAINRALLVLSGSADKATKISILDSGMRLASTSDLGDSNDTLNYEPSKHDPEEPFYVDPGLVARAAKACSHIYCLDKVLLLSNDDASFIHMISHCTA